MCQLDGWMDGWMDVCSENGTADLRYLRTEERGRVVEGRQ